MPAADLRRKWADLRGTDDEGEWRKSLQGLYDAGVIGYAKGERHRSAIWTQRIVFSYSSPQAKVPMGAAVVIHPSFWSAYGVTPLSFRTPKP